MDALPTPVDPLAFVVDMAYLAVALIFLVLGFAIRHELFLLRKRMAEHAFKIEKRLAALHASPNRDAQAVAGKPAQKAGAAIQS